MPMSVLFGSAGFSSKLVISPPLHRDDTVFFRLVQRADIVDAEHRLILFAAKLAELLEALGKEIVARDHDEVAACRARPRLMQRLMSPIAPELVRVARRAVVDDLEGQLRVRCVVVVRPRLEVRGELAVRDHVDLLDPVDRREVVDHPFHHRLARDIEQRLGLRVRQRIEARRVAGGEDEDVHARGITPRQRGFQSDS